MRLRRFSVFSSTAISFEDAAEAAEEEDESEGDEEEEEEDEEEEGMPVATEPCTVRSAGRPMRIRQCVMTARAVASDSGELTTDACDGDADDEEC